MTARCSGESCAIALSILARLSLRHVLGRGTDLFQLKGVVELCARAFNMFLAQPIDRHVHYDPINPRVKGGVAAEAFDRLPRLDKALLGQVPGVLFVMDHVVNHSENSCPVTGYQLIKCLGLAGLTPLDQIHVRYISLSQSRFRLHYWTEPAAISFNSESLRSRNGVAIRRDIPPSD